MLQQDYLKELPNSISNIIDTIKKSQSLHFLSKDIISKLQQESNLNLSDLGLALLPIATSFAVTPISNFNVGAIAFDSIGNAYLGANFEFSNTHIGQTIHAEQSAIANAWQYGAKDLSLLVVNYPPCGHCRQFINEVNLADDFVIQLPNSQAKSLAQYLPESFGPNDLNITQRILQTDKITQTTEDDIFSLAKKTQEKSHAPYSNSKSGIAIQYTDDEIITGSYAENAAFNPSLPALQVALNTRRLQGKNWQDIQKCVMFESVTNIQQYDNTKELLTKISNCELEYYQDN